MRRLDRRALFASGAAAALLAATGLSPDSQPKPGGTLRLAVPRDGSLERVARGAMFETLTEIGPDGVMRPALAISWTSSKDARRWQFDLRDAQFADGQEMMVADVIASLETQGVPELDSIRAADGAVEIALRSANPGLPYLLAERDLIIAKGGNFRAEGTGPYKVLRMNPDRGFLAHRIKGHALEGQSGWVDTLEVTVIPDASVRSEALRDGFVDVAVLPQAEGLIGRGSFVYHPSEQDMVLAARTGVGVPVRIGTRLPLDDGRIAQRWWMA
jgi:ABC-type transport system substrate-binding protein